MSNVSFTSNTAHLQNDINIFYTDSGAPPGSDDYTTVIILHGMGFTGENLIKLHDHAHKFNLRTVIWNRRDYAGSTQYTRDELDTLKLGQSVFLDRLGVELGEFLLYFIERHAVPKITSDGQAGGFAIMGWSLGNATALTLFSQKDLLPQANYEILDSYVKTLIIYDATLFAFGWAPSPEDKPPIVFEPLSNFSADGNPSEEAQRSFHEWVSSYYDHPANPELLSELHFAERTTHATSDSWNAQDLAAFVDYGAVMRSEIPMFQPHMQKSIREMSDSVLGLGPGQTPTSTTMAFPKCHIVFLRPTRTTWRCYWFGIRAQRIYEEQKKLGKDMRPAIFLPIEGGNHFAHWDMPEKVIENVAFGVHHNRSTLPT